MDLDINVPPELLAMVPLLTIFLQVLKRIPILQKATDYFPLIALGIGTLLGVFAWGGEASLVIRIIGGVSLGLAASGLYSGVRSLGALGNGSGPSS